MGWETAVVEVCRTISFALIVLLLLFGYRKRNGWEKPERPPGPVPTPPQNGSTQVPTTL